MSNLTSDQVWLLVAEGLKSAALLIILGAAAWAKWTGSLQSQERGCSLALYSEIPEEESGFVVPPLGGSALDEDRLKAELQTEVRLKAELQTEDRLKAELRTGN